jgi:hypothetical protein
MDGEGCGLTEIFQFSSLSIYASVTLQHERDRFSTTQSLHSLYSVVKNPHYPSLGDLSELGGAKFFPTTNNK